MNPTDSTSAEAASAFITHPADWGWAEWLLFLLALLIVAFVLYIAVRMILHRRRLHRMVGTMREDLLLRRELAAMAAGRDVKAQRHEQYMRVEGIRMDMEAARKAMAAQGIDPRRAASWLLLGEPGSGKSRLMEMGGIDYPAGINDFSRAAEATSTFNLWLAEKGMIWDVGGRLFLSRWGGRQDQEWQYFLEQLHGLCRNNLPGGVILTIPADALLFDSSELRDRKVTLIAEEMRALSRITGAYCPVWVVITKCDQIEGFSEFFSLLSDEDCEKPLGWSNPRPDGPYDAAATDLAFNRLVDHLRTLRGSLALHPSIWEKTASGEKRADIAAPIWLLPDKVEALRENLKRYLAGIFTHVRHKKQDRGIFPFRGFWLTAALDKPVITTERVVFEKREGKLHPLPLAATPSPGAAASAVQAPELSGESLVAECEKILSLGSPRHYFTRNLLQQLILGTADQSDYTDEALRRIRRPYCVSGIALCSAAVLLVLSAALRRGGLEQLAQRDLSFWTNAHRLFRGNSIANAPLLGVEQGEQIPLTSQTVPGTKISRREYLYIMTNMTNVPAPLPLFWRPACWVVDHEMSPQLLKSYKDFIDKATVVTMLVQPAVHTSRQVFIHRADHTDTPPDWERADTESFTTLLQITRYGILLMNGEVVQDDINYSLLIRPKSETGRDAAVRALWLNSFERNKTFGTMTILNGYLRPVSIEAAQAITKASALYSAAADNLSIYPSLGYGQMADFIGQVKRLRETMLAMGELEEDFAEAVRREDSTTAESCIRRWQEQYKEARRLAATIAEAEQRLHIADEGSLRRALETVRNALSEALGRDLQSFQSLDQSLGTSQNADFLHGQLAALTSSVTQALTKLSAGDGELLTDELCRFWDKDATSEGSPRPWREAMSRADRLNALFSFPVPAGRAQETYQHRIARVQDARKQYDGEVQALGTSEDSPLNGSCWEQNWNRLERSVLIGWLAEAPHSNLEVLVPEPGTSVARKLPSMPYTSASKTAINPVYEPGSANRRITDLLSLSDYIRKKAEAAPDDTELNQSLERLEAACQHYLTDYVMYWVETIPSYYRINGIRNWAEYVESGDVLYSADVGSILYEIDDLIYDALDLPSLMNEERFPQLTAIRELIQRAKKSLDTDTRRNFQTSADFISKLSLKPDQAWKSLIALPVEKLMNSYWVSWYPAQSNSSFLWWNNYLLHGMRLLKQEAAAALEDDLAACLADARRFPLCNTSRQRSEDILTAYDINDLYDRLGAVAHLTDPQREAEIAKQANSRSIPAGAASLDLSIAGSADESLSNLTRVLSLLADPACELQCIPTLPASDLRSAPVAGGDDLKRLIPVGRRFPYCRILCNGTPLTGRFNLNRQNAADLPLLTEGIPASSGSLRFEFYRHSDSDTPDSTLTLSRHWSALDLCLRPGARLSDDKKTIYAPLTFRDREGYNCLFWFAMSFNREMIAPADWPGSLSLSPVAGDEPGQAEREKELRKRIRETYLTQRNLPRKPTAEDISALRRDLDSLRRQGYSLGFRLILPGVAEQPSDDRIRQAAACPYFSLDSAAVSTGKLRSLPDATQETDYLLAGGDNVLLRLYRHAGDEYSVHYLDRRRPLLDLVLEQATEYDPSHNYFIVPLKTDDGQPDGDFTLYLRPCLTPSADDGLLPPTEADFLMEYPAADMPDGDLPLN